MRVRFSPREQRVILLGGVGALVILWVYVVYLVQPLIAHMSSVAGDVRTARTTLKALEDATAHETSLREQYHQMSESVAALRSTLPGEEELPAMIEFLSGLANQTSVRIQTIFPQRSLQGLGDTAKGGLPSSPVVYQEIPIQIDALGGYHQLGAFLNLVEASNKPIQLASLHIVANRRESKRHLIKLVLRSYFSVKDATPLEGSAPPSGGR